MTTAVAPPPVKRRWKRRLLIVGVSLLLVAAAAYAWIVVSARWSLAAVIAELDANDPHWRLDEIEARRETVPDAENSALLIIALAKKSRGISITAAPYDKIFPESLPPTARLNAQQTQHLEARFKLLGKVREEWRALKDMPRGRFPIRYSEDYFSSVTESGRSCEAQAYLKHDAWLLAEERKIDEAVASCRAMLNSCRPIGDEPFLLCMQRRYVFRDSVIDTLERVLAQGEAGEAELLVLQELIEEEDRVPLLTNALRGERAGRYQIFLAIEKGTVNPGNFGSNLKGKKSFSDWFHEAVPAYARHYPGLLRDMTGMVQASDVPLCELIDSMEAWQSEFVKRGNYFSMKIVPSPRVVTRGLVYTHARLRCAAVALACERYRLRRKEWPASLDALVQAKLLDAVPVDPFDAKPLRLLRTKEGVTIYSVGLDRIDNQGAIDHAVLHTTPGIDVGFRLWDVPRRRGPPLPLVTLDAEDR